jgi:hypothetical protein
VGLSTSSCITPSIDDLDFVPRWGASISAIALHISAFLITVELVTE